MPTARPGVAPARKRSPIEAPPAPSLYAFSYTVPAQRTVAGSFVIAGSAEAPEGRGSYRDRTIRFGEQSPAALREKAQWVLGEMERRMTALGSGWSDATATQLYTVFDVHPFLGAEIVRRGAAPRGASLWVGGPPGGGPGPRGGG